MSWVRLLIIALLLIISLFAESFIQENASHVYNATIPSLINCALLLMGCILVILSDLEGGGRNKKGLRLLSLLIVFLIGVNFLSSIIRAPTNYEILTSIDKTKFASVDVSSNGLMVLSGTIGGPTTKSLVKSIESTSRNILISRP